MANEIDLFRDLKDAENLIKVAKENKDKPMLKAWQKEKKNIKQKIIKNYPDLKL